MPVTGSTTGQGAVTPDQQIYRTPVRTALDHAGVTWETLAGTTIAKAPGGAALLDAARQLGIADLSPLPRIGFKGRETIQAMKSRGVTVEAVPNRAFPQPDGSLCLVLAASEVFLIAPLSGDGAALTQLEASWSLDDGERTYPLLRAHSHARFLVTGNKSPEMFAKICGIDLRREKFANNSIAQTSVAKLSAIVVRSDIGSVTAFHVLVDSASALYFFECLMDAAQEFGGQLIDLKTAQDLESG